jgi:tRNA pseudouridine38-40 synthase
VQRIRLILEYDGTHFSGWQVQPGERTVQGVIEAAAARLLGGTERVVVRGAGRTDAGVHALAQVAVLDDPRDLPLEAWRRGLTGKLPEDVVVLEAERVALDFDPRRQATGKRYRYRIWNGPVRRPLLRHRAAFVPRPLDLDAMRAGAVHLVGRHDFSSFRATGCTARHPTRTLYRLEVHGEAGAEVSILAEGDGFLRHMVRNLAGTLIEVGERRRPAESLAEVLAARDRSAAGRTAPPYGLYLEAVYYGPRP